MLSTLIRLTAAAESLFVVIFGFAGLDDFEIIWYGAQAFLTTG
jgi:hypothetical protein